MKTQGRNKTLWLVENKSVEEALRQNWPGDLGAPFLRQLTKDELNFENGERRLKLGILENTFAEILPKGEEVSFYVPHTVALDFAGATLEAFRKAIFVFINETLGAFALRGEEIEKFQKTARAIAQAA